MCSTIPSDEINPSPGLNDYDDLCFINMKISTAVPELSKSFSEVFVPVEVGLLHAISCSPHPMIRNIPELPKSLVPSRVEALMSEIT